MDIPNISPPSGSLAAESLAQLFTFSKFASDLRFNRQTWKTLRRAIFLFFSSLTLTESISVLGDSQYKPACDSQGGL